MGIFNASIEIGNPSGSRFETISALVDAGASFTTLPGPFLYSLGVTPHDQFTFTLADGRQNPAGRGADLDTHRRPVGHHSGGVRRRRC